MPGTGIKRNADGIEPARKYLDAVRGISSLSDLTGYLTDPEKNPFCFLTNLSVTLDTGDTADWAARVREDTFSVLPRIYHNGTEEDIEDLRSQFRMQAGHMLKRAGYTEDEIERIIKECFELEELIEEDWLSEEGRNAAIAKLDNMAFSVLRPDQLIDTSYLDVDPAIVGAGAVAGFCTAMLAGFIVLGYIMFGVDRLMARFSK